MREALTQVPFGEWLKRQRGGRGLTQQQLADQIGCAAVTLRKIEAEERRPSEQIVERLAEIFHIPQNERTNFLKYARGDWSKAPGEVIRETPWRTPVSLHTNLPAPITSFIGRENEQKEVIELIRKNRLVTLIGPPGIGKTRLSIETARQLPADFPDGVFFVELAPLDEPSLIASTVLQTLGYVESKNLSADKQLMQGIADKRLLIVLDNCEHLIQDVAGLASGLLSTCPHLKMLATSRESLRVTGEWLFAVPMLPAPEVDSSISMENVSDFAAVSLFAERARAVHSNFTLDTNNLQSVVSICTRLDGLPLAIELIAAQIRLHSAQSLLERLNDQYILSTEGARDALRRQISLNHAIGWSYDSLAPDEQRLFAYLAVFSGGFTLSAAEAIFSDHFPGKSISDLITSLLDKSLLQRASNSPGEVRFSMLATIQQFALDRLRQMGEEGQVRDWHLAYFLDLAERADQHIHGPDQLKWTDWVEAELDNFRAALSWCVSDQKTESALRLLTRLSEAWIRRDHLHEMHSWFNAIRLLPKIMDNPLLYARLVNYISQSRWILGDFTYAKVLLDESQSILLKLGLEGEPDLAMNLCWMGMVTHVDKADIKTAQSLLERSLELYKKYGDRWGMAFVSMNMGLNAGEFAEVWKDDVSAVSLVEQSLELFRQLGDVWGMGRASQLLGQLLLKQGDYGRARFYFEEHLKIDETLRFEQGTSIALQNLGNLYRYQGDYDQATGYYEKSMIMSREYGDTWALSNSIWYLGLVALHRNKYQLAWQKFIDYYNLARVIYRGGIGECDLFTAMAAVAGEMNQPERAAKLHGAAQVLFETTDYRIPPFDRAEFDRHIQMAEKQLGGAKFEEYMSEGYAMTMEQAVACALAEIRS